MGGVSKTWGGPQSLGGVPKAWGGGPENLRGSPKPGEGSPKPRGGSTKPRGGPQSLRGGSLKPGDGLQSLGGSPKPGEVPKASGKGPQSLREVPKAWGGPSRPRMGVPDTPSPALGSLRSQESSPGAAAVPWVPQDTQTPCPTPVPYQGPVFGGHRAVPDPTPGSRTGLALSLSPQPVPPCPQSAVSVPRDFEGCSTLRKYLGQLHFLQSRVPMGAGQDAAVPVTWSGRGDVGWDVGWGYGVGDLGWRI